VQVSDLGDVGIHAQVDTGAVPDLAPADGVPLQELVERPGHVAGPVSRLEPRLGDGRILRGEQRNDLLDDDLLATDDIDGEELLHKAVALEWSAVAKYPCSRRCRDANPGLVGLNL